MCTCISYFSVDVSDKDQCVAVVKAVADANNGNVHLLVNCTVYFGSKGVANCREERLGQDLYFKRCWLFQHSPSLSSIHERHGGVDKSIVNIASILGQQVQPNC